MLVDIHLDSEGHPDGVIQINGRLYSLERTYQCCICGLFGQAHWQHDANVYKGRNYHLSCLRDMYKKSPRETMDGKDRAARIIVRLSRNRILSPDYCDSIDSKMKRKIGHGWRGNSIQGMEYGVLNGRPLIDPDNTNWPEQKQLIAFWRKASKTEFTGAQFELAILLTLLGDNHGITHATRGNANIVRGCKKAHTRNNPEHSGRRA